MRRKSTVRHVELTQEECDQLGEGGVFAIGDLLEVAFGPRPSKRQVAEALFKFWNSAVGTARAAAREEAQAAAIEERQYLERKMNCTCPYNCEC